MRVTTLREALTYLAGTMHTIMHDLEMLLVVLGRVLGQLLQV